MNAHAHAHANDLALAQALTTESAARAGALRAQTLRNILFVSAAVVGAVGLGIAATVWAYGQGPSPEELAAVLAKLPPLKVAPVQIADGSEVTLKEGG